jgi:hypothetical protein
MSATVTVVITLPTDTVASANSRIFKLANGVSVDDQFTATRQVADLIDGIQLGTSSAQIQITTRDTDPAVTTSGAGSIQKTFNLK